MVAFTGIDTISNMAEEARDQAKTIPAAMRGVVAAVMTISLTLPAVALSAMPVENGSTPLGEPASEGGFAGDPITGLVLNLGVGDGLQRFLEVYVGLLAATILLVATNAGLIGLSRLSYSMGQYRQLPEKVRQLHPRFRTPYVAIIVFGAIACLTMLPGQADFLGTVYAFGAMLSFIVAHLSVIALRVRQPDAERPFRGPGNLKVRGYDLPLFAIVGALGTGAAFIAVTALNVVVLVFGGLWLTLGMTVYFLYRRQQGLPIGQTHKIITPDPIVEHEVEYESILVAFEDGEYSGEAVAMAVRLAARRRRGIHVLVTITVPANAPIDASMPDAEAKAQAAVDRARMRGGRRVTGHYENVRAGGAGRRIVSEAREIHAAAIVMPLPRKRAGSSFFGRTLETVLAERPCRVIIDSSLGMAESGDKRGGVMQRVLGASSLLLATLLLVLGVVMVVSTLARGGGPGGPGRGRRRAVRARGRGTAVPGGRASAAGWVAVNGEGRVARGLGQPALFAIGISAVASSLYYVLGIVAGRRPGADAAGVRRRGTVLRAHHAHLRRGQLAAPRARRGVRPGPVRLQRAVELHRGLGDPPGLPDRAGHRRRGRPRTTWPPSGGRRTRGPWPCCSRRPRSRGWHG